MKIIKKIILMILAVMLILSQDVIYASMADYTDEQADKNLKQEQEEWKKEQQERINKSSNNYLKSLSVKKYSIAPDFDKQTINYEISAEISDDYIEIEAETDDEKSSVSGIGKIGLSSGENNLKVDVTAENGTVRSYFIKVIKTVTKNNIRLNDLKLKTENNNIEITPEFDKDTFEYSCNVQNYVEKIDVEAIANYETANIEVTGNENLQEGLNEILISIFQNDDEKVIYKINVYKEKGIQSQNKVDIEKYKNIVIIAIAIIVTILVFLITKKIRKRKSKKRKRKH